MESNKNYQKEEPHSLKREVNNLDTIRHLKMRPPRDAYLFIPNDFQIIEVNKDKPQKSLRRIFEGKFDYNEYETTKLSELMQEINKKNSKEKKDSKNIIDILQLKKWDILRLLQATCFDVGKTSKLILAHVTWRNEKFPNYVFRDKSMEILEKGFIYVHGRDYQYRPILVVNAQVYMKIKDNYKFEDWENFIIFFMRYLINNLLIPGQVENWTMITDVRGVSLYSLPSDFKKLMGVLSSNYRCRLFVNYIFGMSSVLDFLWKIFQMFLDETAKKKIRFIRDGNKEDIFTYINRSQIEKKYGGNAVDKTSEFFPGFMPSEEYLIESQNKKSFLISEEKYKILCNEGKIAFVNQEILASLELKNKKISDNMLEINKSTSDFRLMKSTAFNLNLNEEEAKVFNNLMSKNNNINNFIDHKMNGYTGYEYCMKIDNSFNLLEQKTSSDIKDVSIKYKKDCNLDFFRMISDVKSEFCDGMFLIIIIFF